MESPILGLILDSSIIIAAERKKQTVEELLLCIRAAFGSVEVAISAITVAELVHGIYRANSADIAARRRAFIEEVRKHVPVHPISADTAELAGRVGGEQAAVGNTLPFEDLLIAASALEQGYAVATSNLRHFRKIPGLRVLTRS